MLKIVEIGIVLQSPEGKDFRYVTLRDTDKLVESKYIVYKYNQPYLWKNIEKAETQNNSTQIIPGKIEQYNGIYIVIFDGESPHDAYQKQKWKFKEQKKITRQEAIAKIVHSEGYITNNSEKEAINMPWAPLNEEDVKVKIRYYHPSSKHDINKHSYFEWSEWFEIVD